MWRSHVLVMCARPSTVLKHTYIHKRTSIFVQDLISYCWADFVTIGQSQGKVVDFHCFILYAKL